MDPSVGLSRLARARPSALVPTSPGCRVVSSFSWFNQFQGNPQKRNYDDGDDHSTLISRVLNPYGNLVDPLTDPFCILIG